MTPGLASNGPEVLPGPAELRAASPPDAPTPPRAPNPSEVQEEAELADWPRILTTPGIGRDRAMAQLHDLLLRAAYHEVRRLCSQLPGASQSTLDELANGAADAALAAVLAKLDTFEGRSRFTTWAYKFAIYEAATEVRRRSWTGREVTLDDGDRLPDPHPGPAELAEARDLAGAVRAAIDDVLTTHQRRVALALLVDDIPIDVLADRLGTTRGALYKVLHDARGRLRAHLVATGYLTPAPTRTGAS